MARVEPTDEQLRAAWLQRRHGDWPETFEAVMQHPTYSRLVKMHATHTAVTDRVVQRPVVDAPTPPLTCDDDAPRATRRRLPRRALLKAPSLPPMFDRKRAAAGDRDDD